MTGAEQHPQIKVYAKDELVGSLVFEQPRVCQFQYSASWIEKGYPISPHLPLIGQIASNSVVNFIRNLFPEGSAFDVLLETENLSKNNLYAILRTIGWDTAGALTFTEGDPKSQTTQLRLITEDELVQRLNNNADITLWDGKFRLSVAGVQSKLNVYVDDKGSMYLADGKYASTHILKFAANNFPTIVVNELYCMRLAEAVGLDVASVTHKKLGDHSALLVKRFDRREIEGGVDKRHMIDGCQALDLSPEYKYEQNFGSGEDVAHIRDGVSFKKLFDFANKCSVPALVTQKIIDWFVFNLIIGNSDAHGKNISFFISQSELSVTPFYDLVSIIFEATQQERLDTNLAMGIDENFNINTISAYDLLSLADEVGIKYAYLKRRIDRLATVCRNLSHRLDFTSDDLSPQQANILTALAQLVDERCEALLVQSKQFRSVITSI